jgi:hypothetical protein
MSHFYLYHKGYTQRRYNEMWSLLLDDLTDHLSGIVKELYFSFLKGVLVKTESILLSGSLQHWLLMEKFNKVFQYFPVGRHTFLSCDRGLEISFKNSTQNRCLCS